jgi:hypothetical protein
MKRRRSPLWTSMVILAAEYFYAGIYKIDGDTYKVCNERRHTKSAQ